MTRVEEEQKRYDQAQRIADAAFDRWVNNTVPAHDANLKEKWVRKAELATKARRELSEAVEDAAKERAEAKRKANEALAEAKLWGVDDE